MSKSKKITLSAMAVLSAVALASHPVSAKSTSGTVSFPSAYKNTSAASKSANNKSTLKVAEPNDSPFEGISDPVLASNAEDADVFAPGGLDTLFFNDKNYKIVNGGLANLKLDRKAKTATITIRKNAKWSNGMAVTAKDVEYAYEVIANPNTTSQQYSSDFATIEGMTAYHAGKAKTISGFTYPDGQNGKQVVIHFTKMSPSMKYAGNSFIWDSVEPYEYIKNVSIAKLASSSQVRKNPIFTGAYKLDKVVEGESTTWSPNKYYFGKKAKIKHIVISVVSSSNVDKAIQSKKYDFTSPNGVMHGTDYKELKNLKDYSVIGLPELGYDYFGFNVGHYDTKTQKNVMDKNSKMANRSLRQAMMYALNLDAVEKKFGYGVSWRANTLLPPVFSKYYNKSAKGYPLNIKKANELLDKAGYKKKGKWRVRPNGKPLTIYFGAMQGTSAQQAEYQDYLQQWHKIGLNVKLATGKEMEMNSFYDTLEKPKQSKIDVYAAAWSLSSEPTPTQIYGEDAPYNMGHFVSKENTKLMNEMNGSKAWTESYRVKVFKKWQAYMNKEAAYAPGSFSYTWAPVNHRVKGYNVSPSNNEFWSNLSLTSSKIK
ncbi:oligopeptide ABC transporter substrate-binding protein [Oenococcus oeni]|uniref:oligopeptide ABC transporter substrate-binding protein n=1 Tax=Oenococcus oeni TaxID=1247 RepID=UPI000298475A|nr:oligopeptide ABC transporter substrate-binding protein [Oenococcus oeni]EKP91048.1 ABC-type dipeptide/oligopeptide/nickel transport system, periplasmic component [Oenococcus oeni AWRIB202]